MEKDVSCELNDTSMIAIGKGRDGEEQDGSGKKVKLELLEKGEAAQENNRSQLKRKRPFEKDEDSFMEDVIVDDDRPNFDEEHPIVGETLADDAEEVDSSIPQICFSAIELQELHRPWKNAVIIKLIGKTVGNKCLLSRIINLWAVESEMGIVDIGRGYFVVRLSSCKDYEHALTGGPWHIADHYLTVRKWEPEFRPLTASLTTAMWVRFPELPVEYFGEDMLFKMGNMVGKTLKLNKLTGEVGRGRFARVAVQVDLNKPLVSKFRLGKLIQRVEYEGIHMICFKCGLYGGHQKDQCPKRKTTDLQPKSNAPSKTRPSLETQKPERGMDLDCAVEMTKSPIIRREIQIGWKKPEKGWKLNVDGCAKGNPGLAAAGGLFRNEKGDWITGFTVNIGTTTSTTAELIALWEGLQRAKEFKLESLEIETDSQVVLKLIGGRISPDGLVKLKGFIDGCKMTLQANTGFRVNHVYRESNFCADWLANYGLKQPLGSSIVNDIPPELLLLLEKDKRGETYPRMITE